MSPRGVAVDPVSGNVYVADGNNDRIQEFTAWGAPLRVWGWGVVASGHNDDPRNEIQEVTVDATAGTFALRYYPRFGSETTVAIPFDASAATVQAALEGLGSIAAGDVLVGGPDGGPWTIEFAGNLADRDVLQLDPVNSTLSGGAATATAATTQPGANFEVCVPAEGDVCAAGQGGLGGASPHPPTGAPGQLSGPAGLALDSAGDLYVFEIGKNRRVQKFDLSGPKPAFAWTIGGGVNQGPGSPGNLCTAADVAGGDTCGAGTAGSGAGEFGFGLFFAPDRVDVAGKGTESAADDVLYVGDKDRIQEFDAAGNYLGEIPFTGGSLPEAGFAAALAVDPGSGDLYFAYSNPLESFVNNQPTQPGIYRLDPATGEEEDVLDAQTARALAAGADGHVYAFRTPNNQTMPNPFGPAILEFDQEGKLVESTDAKAAGLDATNGLAASSACGIEGTDLFVANDTPAFVRIYGPPPQVIEEPCSPPPLVAPAIRNQHALSVGSEGASVQAQVNPLFWPDAHYYVQYGTGRCSEGGCTQSSPVAPGPLLTDRVVSAYLDTKSVFLGGLQPGTTYHYRFVAESSGGGPSFGEGGPKEASETEGLEASFTTYPLTPPAKADCPNQAFRTGLSAPLPDCRAYELVSPLDKDNGDIGNDENIVIKPAGNFEAAAADGERATYSSYRAFAEPEGAPLISQYLSSRGPGGWSTHSISPPRSSVPFYEPGARPNTVQFKAFSADLCGGWFIQDTAVELAPGAPEGAPAFYRREDRDCGAAGYELFTPVGPTHYAPSAEGSASTYYLELQGVSGDGETALLRIDDALTEGACELTIEDEGEALLEEGKGIFELYLQRAGAKAPVLVSVLRSGAAACVHSSAGTNQGPPGTSIGDSVVNALATDGSRAFWSTSASVGKQRPATGGEEDMPGPLYVRLNPAQPQSETAFGGANGTGNLLGPAKGTGKIVSGNTTVFSVETTSGKFAVGQEISDSAGGIPAGTTIVEVKEGEKEGKKFVKELVLSAAATKTQSSPPDELSASSKQIFDLNTEYGEFKAGQSITGPGIPAGTTVSSVGASSLTLSAAATQFNDDAPLEAFSACIQPSRACTVQISGAADTRFWGADPQGERAIYTAGGALREYDVAAAASTTLAPEGVVGVMGTSTDLSRVYFASTANLTGGQANSEGDVATAGKPNLYLRERGVGTVFVGTLAAADVSGTAESAKLTPVAPLPYKRTSRVSADGLHAAFTSAAQLSGYENTDVASGKSDAEVFLYDAAPGGGVGKLACVSCNPSGARPRGANINIYSEVEPYWAAAQLPVWESEFAPTRALSADGQRLFFESFENLVPRDANGKRDVYEWRRASGQKECEEAGAELYVASAGGCIALISSGTSSVGSEFLDASSSGTDVFFTTAASLLPYDPGLVDVYDARVGGGLPPPAEPTPGCEGEACQSPAPAPRAPNPASSAYEGAGNQAGGRRSCGTRARAARKAARRASRLRRAARRSDSARLRRRAGRALRRAKRQRRATRRCRARASRRAKRR